MTPEQRLNAANEINGLWVRQIRNGEIPPDVLAVAGIIERFALADTALRHPMDRRLLIVSSTRR
jgi:hypothetical protein